MLDREKEEINRWLQKEYPEVFRERALDSLLKKVERKEKSLKKESEKLAEKIREKERPIVVENDLVQHLTNRIDHYLFKRWPDFFIEKELEKWKSDLYEKYNDMRGKEDRINARYLEWETRQEARIEKLSASLLNKIKQMEDRIMMLDHILSIGRKWWEFWKTSIIVLHETKEEEED